MTVLNAETVQPHTGTATPETPSETTTAEKTPAKTKTSRFTSLERAWIAYDIGNSAFTLLVSTLIPIWFDHLSTLAGLSDSQYLAYWSYATSIATVISAILGPVLGTLADNKGFKKPMFTFVLVGGCLGCAIMGIAPNWLLYLVTYVVAKVCYQESLVFYDSMLVDVTTYERMDNVSSLGYAWGYLGSCAPFIAALALYMLGESGTIPLSPAIAAAFIVVALWWFFVSVPLLRRYRQTHDVPRAVHPVRESFARLGHTLQDIVRHNRTVLFFLIGFFFYIDGVYTIIDEAVAIGKALGLDTVGLLVVLLATQVVAFASAALFGRLSSRLSTMTLLTICIVGYMLVAVYALFMHTLWQFGLMAFVVGMFQGTIQAISRSYYGSIIPANKSGEYFGLYDICGKGAAFLGTTVIGVAVTLTGSVNIAVATLAVLFIVGYAFLRICDRCAQADQRSGTAADPLEETKEA